MRVPVQRKLEAGAALRDRLKAAGDGLGSQVVADLVGSLRASHQNSAALFAELKEARGLLQGFIDDEADAVTNPLGGLSLGGLMDARDNSGCVYQSAALADRIAQTRAFLARNGKGEG